MQIVKLSKFVVLEDGDGAGGAGAPAFACIGHRVQHRLSVPS